MTEVTFLLLLVAACLEVAVPVEHVEEGERQREEDAGDRVDSEHNFIKIRRSTIVSRISRSPL